MKPIEFDEQNVVFATAPAYEPMPAYRSTDNEIITKWKLNVIERIKILFIGTIWLHVQTNGAPQPVFMTVNKLIESRVPDKVKSELERGMEAAVDSSKS